MEIVDLDLAEIVRIIARIKSETERLKKMADLLPCVDRNCERILASVAMLEINVCDGVEVIS